MKIRILSQRTSSFIAVAILSVLTGTSGVAGIVTWGAPTTVAGDSDVSISGALVAAFNLGGNGNFPATVNGVTFNPFPTTGPVNISGNFMLNSVAPIMGDNAGFGDIVPPFSDLSPDYQILLRSGSFTQPPAPIILTMSGLTIGNQYQFQWWAHASGTSNAPPIGQAAPSPTVTASAGQSVTLQPTPLSGDLGQFAIGTFTADASTQVITFTGSPDRVLLNGFQLRELSASAIPEPGTGMFAFSLLAFVAARRRRGER